MEQRIIFKLFTILSLTFFAGAQDGDKPNIIIFVADDLGYGDLSCYGHPSQLRGGIDELALNGKRFTAAYVPDPNGVASRGALLTGRLPVRIGLYGLDGEDRHVFTATHTTGLPKEEITIAEILRDNGYTTGMVGKWNLGINENTSTDGAHLPKHHGFDYVGYNLPLTNSWECGERHNVDDDVKSRNCFLYKDDVIVEQPLDPMDLTTKFLKDAQKFIQDNRRDPFFLYFGFSNNHVSVSHSDSFSNTSPLGLYGDSTNEMNSAVGNLVDLVEELGLKDNTLVIFLSDNGPYLEMCSEAGYEGALRGGKSTGFEGGIRVPFIVSWPGKVPTGSVSRHAVSSMDILPTIVDVIGDVLPEDVTYDGRSIKDIFYEDLTAVAEWGFEIPSQIDPPHPEGLFFYAGDMLTAMRFDKYKVHFQLPPNPLKTRAEFGAECVEGVPMRSYYEGCRVPDCFQTPPVPIVYLIDEDVGEGFRFTNHSDVEVLDPGFRLKMLDLHMSHVTSVIRGPDLLSFSNQNLDSSANVKVAIFATPLLFSVIAIIFSN